MKSQFNNCGYILFLGLFFSACSIKTVTVRENGQLTERYQVNRKTKEKEGFSRLYHENRQIPIEQYYKEGVLNGTVKIYYADGTLESIAHTKDGMYIGEFEYYYQDGTLKQRGYYKRNKINGNLLTYYPNGQLKEVVFIKDNNEHGPFREYSSTGILIAEGHYITDGENTALEHGILHLYDKKEGYLIKKMRCRAGICCTVWNKEEGYLLPKNDLCRDILNQQNSPIYTQPVQD
jgi:antitoxin component YwqK of YwqJK toxin-antitoxin module